MNFPVVGFAPCDIIPEWQTYAREINATKLNINTKYICIELRTIYTERKWLHCSGLLAKISEYM